MQDKKATSLTSTLLTTKRHSGIIAIAVIVIVVIVGASSGRRAPLFRMCREPLILHEVSTGPADDAAAIDEGIAQDVRIPAIAQHGSTLHNFREHCQTFVYLSNSVKLPLARKQLLGSIKNVENAGLAARMNRLENVE